VARRPFCLRGDPPRPLLVSIFCRFSRGEERGDLGALDNDDASLPPWVCALPAERGLMFPPDRNAFAGRHAQEEDACV
jgi:hypothetical protein